MQRSAVLGLMPARRRRSAAYVFVAVADLPMQGGGCFWCLEACYQQLKGVSKVVSGYSGGHVDNPTYQQVGAVGLVLRPFMHHT
jgi:hypothetical protein